MSKLQIQQATQEVKNFKEAYVPKTFNELAALHPVCDKYDESTSIISEEKDTQKNPAKHQLYLLRD